MVWDRSVMTKSIQHTMSAVLHQCLTSKPHIGTMIYQIHSHGHIVNLVTMHMVCK